MQRPAPARRRLWDDPRIVFPDEETWSRLSPAEREEVIERILAVENDYREAMAEGVRHFRNKAGIGADLDAHFRRARRKVFIASELAVFYPAEPMIVPDVLAVVDCDPDIEPDSWVVQDQKRGIDLVIEVRNLGRKQKDLVENVRDYARLSIPEYFSFDCRKGHLRGWRLVEPGATTYQPIVPQRGYLASNVLQLDLAIVEGRLRFFTNESMVPNAEELIERLQTVTDERQSALEELELALGESEHARAISLVRNILAVCRMRGLDIDEAQQARIVSENDVDVLERWSERAFSVTTAAELLAAD